MKVQVITRAPTRTAALRYVGPYGPGVAAFWQQHFYPFLVRHDLLGRPTYGISHDDPISRAPEACRYDTCVEVDADFVLPAEASFVTIPGGKYALLAFRGHLRHHQPGLARLLDGWLPDSGYQLDGRPCFERYSPDATVDADSGTFICDILIPLARC
jgi:AraC family transcriptional regulator